MKIEMKMREKCRNVKVKLKLENKFTKIEG